MADTTIYLLQGVDLTNEYVNTFDFASASAQAAFFSGKTIKTISAATFQRLDNGDRIIRVQENVENLRNVNYVMFQNETGGKWYYGFVSKVVFSSNNVTHVYYEVDVMQTWFFEMSINPCFVEREHVNSDDLFEHTVNENLDTGELIVRSFDDVSSMDDLITIAGIVETAAGVDSVGDMVSDVFTGYEYRWFDTTLGGGVDALNLFLGGYDLEGKASAIKVLFMVPKYLVTTGGSASGTVTSQSSVSLSKTILFNVADLDTYIPNNKKLFTYPYNFLYVTNNNGGENVYKYEYYNASGAVFNFYNDFSPSLTIYCVPNNYKRVGENYDELLSLNDFPVCNWASDVFANWFGQNKGSLATQALSGIAGAAMGNPIPALAGGLSTIGQFSDMAVKPPQVKGRLAGTAAVAAGIQNYGFYQKTIRKEHAQIIDEYFDRYGYQINRLKVPDINGRTYWNYVKTNKANVTGNISQTDLQKINSIFNTGVTFWHGDYVGNYSLNNSI